MGKLPGLNATTPLHVTIMKYKGKKLPSGWSYILTKKEVTEIDNATGNYISSVNLTGTSYSESKMAAQSTDKTVATIDFPFIDNIQYTYISLHGIRDSNFKSDEELMRAKAKVISDITTIVLEAKNNFEKTNTRSSAEFIKVSTENNT